MFSIEFRLCFQLFFSILFSSIEESLAFHIFQKTIISPLRPTYICRGIIKRLALHMRIGNSIPKKQILRKKCLLKKEIMDICIRYPRQSYPTNYPINMGLNNDNLIK